MYQVTVRYQRSIIFISHDLDEVVQVDTPDEILSNPVNNYVRTFFRGVDISQIFKAKDIARRRPA